MSGAPRCLPAFRDGGKLRQTGRGHRQEPGGLLSPHHLPSPSAAPHPTHTPAMPPSWGSRAWPRGNVGSALGTGPSFALGSPQGISPIPKKRSHSHPAPHHPHGVIVPTAFRPPILVVLAEGGGVGGGHLGCVSPRELQEKRQGGFSSRGTPMTQPCPGGSQAAPVCQHRPQMCHRGRHQWFGMGMLEHRDGVHGDPHAP